MNSDFVLVLSLYCMILRQQAKAAKPNHLQINYISVMGNNNDRMLTPTTVQLTSLQNPGWSQYCREQ